MSSSDYTNPRRYDFKVDLLDLNKDIKPVNMRFGQYVTFDDYWNLLCAFSDYEDSRQEEEEQ